MIALGAFNQEKALVGTFSVIVKFSQTFVQPLFEALVSSLQSDTGQQAGLLMSTAKKGRKGSVPGTGSWSAFQLVGRQSGGGLVGNRNRMCTPHLFFVYYTINSLFIPTE